MRTLWQDVRYGLRMLGKSPGFTALIVLVLAVGIGVNTAIFLAVNAWLNMLTFRVDRPERIVSLAEGNRPWGMQDCLIRRANLADWRRRCTSFEAMAPWQTGVGDLRRGPDTEKIAFQWCGLDVCRVLGIRPRLGRAFALDEDQPGKQGVLLLGHRVWKARFGGDPNVLGQSVFLNDQPYRIIGVLPPDLGPLDVMGMGVWVPVPQDPGPQDKIRDGFSLLARLKTGVTLEQATREVDTVARSFAGAYLHTGTDWTVNTRPLLAASDSASRPALLIQIPVGLVLLIACSNAASLILARGSARKREISVRLALGAGRSRIVQQLLTESVLCALFAGSAGLLLLAGGLSIVRSVGGPQGEMFTSLFGVDKRVLLFVLLVSTLTGIVCGLVPALQVSKQKLSESLKVAGLSALEGKSRLRFLNSLVVVEFVVSLVLFVTAGLTIRSFLRVQHTELGFEPRNLLTISVRLSEPQYATESAQRAATRALLEQLQTLPGVQSLAVSNDWPFDGAQSVRLRVVGASEEADPPLREMPLICPVNPEYFTTLCIRVLRGRGFGREDEPDTSRTVIVNQALAQRLWPEGEAVGRRLEILDRNLGVHEVVGVVANVKHFAFWPEDKPTVYVPLARCPTSSLKLTLRTAGDPAGLGPAARARMAGLIPERCLLDIGTMRDVMSQSSTSWLPRMLMIFMTILSVLALVLSSTGIYGIMAYATSQRTQEIGIRLALGAQTANVLVLVMRRGLRLTAIGLALGSALALGVAQIMRRLLYETSPMDPVTFAGVCLLLAAVALLACYVPARRAARIDPMVALRYE
jgi:predicted permease